MWWHRESRMIDEIIAVEVQEQKRQQKKRGRRDPNKSKRDEGIHRGGIVKEISILFPLCLTLCIALV